MASMLSVSTAHAAYLDLAWNANTEPDLAGYKVYYGQSSGAYTDHVDVGINTTYRLRDLEEGVTYYIALTAYDLEGVESEYSDEVSGTAVPGPSGHLVLGFGPYPSSTGWVEVCDQNYANDEWFRVQWDAYNAANGEARIATGDIDGDGKDEIVVGLGPVPGDPAIPGGWFELFDDDHTHLAWGHVNWSIYNSSNGETWPACGDTDGDGKAEVLVALGNGGGGWIETFDWAGDALVHREWQRLYWKGYNTVHGETRPACGDIDGDGKDEIIVGLGPVPGDSSLAAGWFEVIDDDATHLTWGKIQWTDYNSTNGEARPACGDVDGDGKDEIIIGLGRGGGGWVEIFDYDSATVCHKAWTRLQWSLYNSTQGETRPTSADVDGDGRDEIILGLGADGAGLLEVLDDASAGYAHLDWPKVHWTSYNEANGETWPAVIY